MLNDVVCIPDWIDAEHGSAFQPDDSNLQLFVTHSFASAGDIAGFFYDPQIQSVQNPERKPGADLCASVHLSEVEQ
eukprot:CAMPEP_0184691048 /NCGR_PEP_ID=MMETSP0312-20130426/31600_1 /TAXON_ID=31354 /ORGANISM="Compsopogon coeruleus, Strain SAG 36.94" /LENGTH=75 /DNA_ID=CAMNT_0027148675 /DNA_START=722 /DNA_END=946 /DNA_ORIENTATION=-